MVFVVPFYEYDNLPAIYNFILKSFVALVVRK
jgi:hypothetical protein